MCDPYALTGVIQYALHFKWVAIFFKREELPPKTDLYPVSKRVRKSQLFYGFQ